MKSGGRRDGLDDALILFRLERAGGVDEPATRREAAGCADEDVSLAGRLAGQFLDAQIVPDLGISGEGAGAGAGNIAENQVKGVRVGRWCGGIGDLGLNPLSIGITAKPCRCVGEPLAADVGGANLGGGKALGEHQGFAAGGSAAVPTRVARGLRLREAQRL